MKQELGIRINTQFAGKMKMAKITQEKLENFNGSIAIEEILEITKNILLIRAPRTALVSARS